MEKVQWKVEGMSCANCALTIHKYLEKEGMKEVKVNAIGGDVSFDMNGTSTKEKLVKGIKVLGYNVVDEQKTVHDRQKILTTPLGRFWFCFPFTLVMMLPMVPTLHISFLMKGWVQLILCLPVYATGLAFLGKSALKSMQNRMPNMNVLIALGASAAFVYSLYGTLSGHAEQYMFYETTAAIITIVFLGNYLEDVSLRSTQRALNALSQSQKIMANLIAYDNEHQEHVFPVENGQLKPGDLVLIKTGEQVPTDGKILWGEAELSEAIVTGESLPVLKYPKDTVIGGSLVLYGTIKAQVTAVGNDTILSGIINLVKRAQGDKPPVQQLADRISAIFVPLVIAVSTVVFAANWIILERFTDALLRGIAVLVIACPCAMGLATPAAIAVGLGRAARSGILFRNATSLELFRSIQQVVFDKTGTLTTGQFSIAAFHNPFLEEAEFKRIIFSMEKYSNHPIAKSIAREWKTKDAILWKKIEELKGVGMVATDKSGNEYQLGSFKLAATFTREDNHSVYLLKNGEWLGWINVKDEVRREARLVIDYLRSKKIKTILLSGDRLEKCQLIANELGIDEVIAEKSPEQKLNEISALTALAPTAMVGDGINDAPALARATVGISMSDASQTAMQTAQVVLMGNSLKNLPAALGLGRHTYITIKQNLFWAFFYNLIAIPVAAFGLLSPILAALIMGFSDVILAINSARLFVKKVV